MTKYLMTCFSKYVYLETCTNIMEQRHYKIFTNSTVYSNAVTKQINRYISSKKKKKKSITRNKNCIPRDTDSLFLMYLDFAYHLNQTRVMSKIL